MSDWDVTSIEAFPFRVMRVPERETLLLRFLIDSQRPAWQSLEDPLHLSVRNRFHKGLTSVQDWLCKSFIALGVEVIGSGRKLAAKRLDYTCSS